MSKVIPVVLISLLFACKVSAQCNLPYKSFFIFDRDTTTFLRYNFDKRKDCYTNKPIETIFKDLDFPPKSFTLLSENGKEYTGIYLYIGNSTTESRLNRHPLKFQFIHLTFLYPKKLDEVAEFVKKYPNDKWVGEHYDYFKDVIVSEVAYYGPELKCDLPYKSFDQFNNDTTTFLRYNFKQRKDCYVEKSVATILKDMELTPKTFTFLYGWENECIGIRIYMDNSTTESRSNESNLRTLSQDIRLTFLRPKSWYEMADFKRKLTNDKWTQQHYDFFKDMVISEVIYNGPTYIQCDLPYRIAYLFYNDTTAFLRYNFKHRKDYYINKSVGTILEDLQYLPKSFTFLSENGKECTSINIYLDNSTTESRSNHSILDFQFIHLTFLSPKKMDEIVELTKIHSNERWAQQHYNYFKDDIVSEVAYYEPKLECNLPYKSFDQFNNDTTAFLHYNFKQRKDCYADKSVNTILKDMELSPQSFDYSSSGYECKAIEIYLDNSTTQSRYNRPHRHISESQSIHLTFLLPKNSDEVVDLIRKHSKEKWVPQHYDCFKDAIVSKIAYHAPTHIQCDLPYKSFDQFDNDTTRYLHYNFEERWQCYFKKSIATILSDLELSPKSFTFSSNDKGECTYIHIYVDNSTSKNRSNRHILEQQYISIEFLSPIEMNEVASLTEKHTPDKWVRQHYNYFKDMIISKVDYYGPKLECDPAHNPYRPFEVFDNDTTAFLNYNFQERKDCYVKKDIATILKDIKLPPKSFTFFSNKENKCLSIDIYVDNSTSENRVWPLYYSECQYVRFDFLYPQNSNEIEKLVEKYPCDKWVQQHYDYFKDIIVSRVGHQGIKIWVH